jgi:hypothetical protein
MRTRLKDLLFALKERIFKRDLAGRTLDRRVAELHARKTTPAGIAGFKILNATHSYIECRGAAFSSTHKTIRKLHRSYISLLAERTQVRTIPEPPG